jgi:DNA-binding NtrC family response regulator
MDGLALLALIKEKRPATPTLLITGHGEGDLGVRAVAGGAFEYISKPIDRDSFITSLERAIQSRPNGRVKS